MKKSRNNTRYRSMLLSCMGVCLVMLILIFIVIYNYFYQASIRKAREVNILSITMLQNYLDDQIRSMDEIQMGLRSDIDLLNAIIESSRYDSFRLSQKLYTYISINPHLLDIAIFDFNQDRVFSSSGPASIDNYLGFNLKMYQDGSPVDAAQFQDKLMDAGPVEVYDFVDVKAYNNAKLVPVSLYVRSLSNTRKIIFFVKKDLFYKPLLTLIGDFDGEFYMTDSQNRVLLHMNLNNGLEEDFDCAKIRFDSVENVRIGTCGKNIVAAAVSTESMFHYYIVSNPKAFMQDLDILKLACILSVVGLLLAGLAGTLFFTNIMYRPVKKLQGLISPADGEEMPSARNEFDLIGARFQAIQQKAELAQRQLESEREYLCENLVINLVTASAAYSSDPDLYASRGIVFPMKMTKVYVIRTAAANRKLCAAILDKLVKGFEVKAFLSAQNTYNLVIMLLNYRDPSQEATIAEAIEKVFENNEIDYRMGIGEYADTPDRIRHSFTQSLAALGFCETGKGEKVCRYGWQKERYRNRLEEFTALQPRIIEAVKQCEGELAESLTRKAFDISDEPQLCSFIFSNLISRLILTARSVGYADDGLDALIYSISEDKEQMIQKFLHGASLLAEYLSHKNEIASDELAEQVRMYIEDNYSNKELGVQMVAEHLGVSQSYLTKHMKSLGECTVFTMIYTRRMECAKKLLEETTLQIKEIVEQSGYGDVNYFVKKFKKVTGLTPTQYRESFQKET